MQIAKLILEPLRIPFRVSFRHAAAERNMTQSFLVIARSTDDLMGYGEGCPRDYVTGETDASVAAFFGRHRDGITASINGLSALRAWAVTNQEDIDRNPAAWCAIELALLDLIARQNRQPVEVLLGLPPLAGPFVYSAVLGATDEKSFAGTLERYRKAGMSDFKIKLSGDAGRDRGNIAVLRAAGIEPGQARADANNLWSDVTAAENHLRSLDFPFNAVEEPLRAGRYDELARLGDALDTRIVLDESVTRVDQLARLPGPPDRWIINLRVSKMGGLLRSLDVVGRCRERGLSLIVGAQVGETSLLTRAALIVAQSARDILVAQEGAFGTLLLERDPMQPTLMFGARGGLDVAALGLHQSPGFGLSPVSGVAAE